MFRTSDPTALRAQLDRFNVPMFAADLRAAGEGFEVVALNTAHEGQSGMCMEEVIHRPLSDILPAEQAKTVNARYTQCVTGAPQLRYREKLQMPHGEIIWDTTLHHIKPRRGADRVVGSAVVVEYVKRDHHDTLAFEDMRFFAASSEVKLGQIATVLDAVERGVMPADQLKESATVLAGLCRAIDTTMRELRSIAEGRLSADLNPVKPLISPASHTSSVMGQSEVDLAISALIEAAGNLHDAPMLEFSDAPLIRRTPG